MNKYFRFIFGLKDFLNETLTIEKSIEDIKQRLANREDNFLMVVKKCIYGYNKSPYLKLLRGAKICFEDIWSFVAKSGIEETLQILRNEGVYLTLDEIKGRKDTLRRNLRFRFREDDCNNPYVLPAFYIQSGGTMDSGTGTRTNISFAFLSQRAEHRCVMFHTHSLFNGPLIIWYPTLGGVEMGILLECAKIGKSASNFFYMVGDNVRKPSFTAKAAFKYLRYIGKKISIGFPIPEKISINNTSEVLNRICAIIKGYNSACVRTFVSSAVRISSIARRNNVHLGGVKFWISGEPLTQGKSNEITSSGASSICQYSFGETGGTVSIGCENPCFPDDTHLFKDLFAVIQNNRKSNYSDVKFNAFLFTTLSFQAPKILLNVENGDYGVIEKRKCGCKLEELGLDTHIHSIRSFEKFNGEGMTVFACDLINLIENVLVPKYGGNSTDYQFIEERDNGPIHTALLVSPEIAGINEDEVINLIYKELSISPAYRTQLALWRNLGTLRIKRTAPLPNSRGKIFPVRLEYISE